MPIKQAASAKKGSPKVEVGSAEIYFAKKLASNDKKVRDRAVNRLRHWLSCRLAAKKDFTSDDFLKLWKGLFYCMWFSDKPLVQEELADRLSEIMHLFSNSEKFGIAFADAFLITMGREWHGIDRLRLDKFYMLLKKFFHETLEFLRNVDWNASYVQEMADSWSKVFLSKQYPDGLKKFFSEYILAELDGFVFQRGEVISQESLLSLISPFLKMLSLTESDVVANVICKEVLEKLASWHEQRSEKSTAQPVVVPYAKIAENLATLAADKAVKTKNRKLMYMHISSFRKLSENQDAKDTNADLRKQSKKSKKKKRKRASTGISVQDENSVAPASVPTAGSSNSSDLKSNMVPVSVVSDPIAPSNSDGDRVPEPMKSEKKRKRSKRSEPVEDNKAVICKDHKEISELPEPANILCAENAHVDVSERATVGQPYSVCVTNYEGKVSGFRDVDLDPTVQKLDFDAECDGLNHAVTPSTDELIVNFGVASSDTGVSRLSDKSKPSLPKADGCNPEAADSIRLKTKRKSRQGLDAPAPFMSFIKLPSVKAFVKKTPKTERKLTKAKRLHVSGPMSEPDSKKKVRIELSKNISVGVGDLKISPQVPFSPTRLPNKGVLKTPSSRRRAVDFF